MTITRTVGVQRMLARQAVEQAAAEARLRHITGAAGQAMVYAAKLAQAQAYLVAQAADSQAPVPPYVAADVAVEGGTAVQRAQAIVDAADAFHDGPGPAIEQVRRAAKLVLQEATTAEAVQQALDEAIVALGAI